LDSFILGQLIREFQAVPALTDYGYHGRAIRSAELAGLVLAETLYLPGAEAPPHAHPVPDLCLVVAGAFHERQEHELLECTPGVLLFREAGTAHSDRFGSTGAWCFNVQFGDDWRKRLSPETWQRSRRWSASTRQSVLARQIYRASAECGSATTASVEELVILLLGMLEPCPPVADRRIRWIERAEECLRARFLDSAVSLSSVAREVGVHPVHFCRTFRHHFGCTPGAYVRRLRVEWARHQLLTTRLPLSVIAYGCGYCDHSHFAREFRQAIGTTPSGFRRRHL
jgi:AraC family transcriptional regulator